MSIVEHLVNEKDEALRWSILVGKQKHNAQKAIRPKLKHFATNLSK